MMDLSIRSMQINLKTSVGVVVLNVPILPSAPKCMYKGALYASKGRHQPAYVNRVLKGSNRLCFIVEFQFELNHSQGTISITAPVARYSGVDFVNQRRGQPVKRLKRTFTDCTVVSYNLTYHIARW